MIRIFSRYISRKAILAFLLDSGLIGTCFLIGAALRLSGDWEDWGDLIGDVLFPFKMLLVAVVYQVCLAFNGLYDFGVARHRFEEMARIGQAVGIAFQVLAVLYFAFPSLMLGRGVFLVGAVLTSGMLLACRPFLVSRVANSKEALLIIGTKKIAQLVTRELLSRKDLGLEIVGYLHDGLSEPDEFETLGRPILGSISDVTRVVEQQRIRKIIVAMEDRRNRLPMSDLVRLRVGGVTIEDAQSLMAALTGRVWLAFVQPSWFVFSDGFRRSRTTAIVKRAIDIALASAGSLVASPILLLIGICIKLDSRGPCIYRQVRVGLRGKLFEVIKFRSMRTDAEVSGVAQWASEDDPRITRVGKWLRKFRLDELPQFYNIIRGDMSFVGPRPERPMFVEELRRQILYYDERHSVRPGLTGWAQVRFHYGASLKDAYRKLEYDLFYLKNMSILYDCMILLQTVQIVLLGWERSVGKDSGTVLATGGSLPAAPELSQNAG